MSTNIDCPLYSNTGSATVEMVLNDIEHDVVVYFSVDYTATRCDDDADEIHAVKIENAYLENEKDLCTVFDAAFFIDQQSEILQDVSDAWGQEQCDMQDMANDYKYEQAKEARFYNV